MFALAIKVILVLRAHRVQLALRERQVPREQLEPKGQLELRELLAPQETLDHRVQ